MEKECVGARALVVVVLSIICALIRICVPEEEHRGDCEMSEKSCVCLVGKESLWTLLRSAIRGRAVAAQRQR